MGQAEEGSPPYELGRVTCIFIAVPRVWDPCPGACPVVRVSGGLPPSPFSPPSCSLFLQPWLISTWDRCPWREVGARAASNQIILEQVLACLPWSLLDWPLGHQSSKIKRTVIFGLPGPCLPKGACPNFDGQWLGK